MKKILDILEEENHIHCYKTRSYSLDTEENNIIEYDDKPVSKLKKTYFAETLQLDSPTVSISEKLIKSQQQRPLFNYFLDGSRHVYKIDDVLIGDRIYPIGGGEIVVGCCTRTEDKIFKKDKIFQQIALSMPENVDSKEDGEPYLKTLLNRFNLSINNGFAKTKNYTISIDKILLYKTDGGTSEEILDKDKFKSRLIAKIQNEMTDHEQIMVKELCNEGKLNDDSWLIKDGSIEYNQNFSNLIQTQIEKSNYKHVVGVSKSFNPDLIRDYKGKRLSKTIAELKPFERTKVYKYEYNSGKNSTSYFAIWYLRLRKSNFRETNFSDIVKCEILLDNEGAKIDSDLVDLISANIINESYPVCYGIDSRWANHLYPIYLTERFCKSKYRDSNIILNLF